MVPPDDRFEPVAEPIVQLLSQSSFFSTPPS